jgi:quercetin dioxygenase-like cupin family protein
MESFELDALVKQHASLDKLYLEFLRVPSLSMGLYMLPAGGTDPQSPHTEDEVYYIVSGEAVISVGDEEHEVRPGSIVCVAANVPHRFHTIRSDLKVLVFFAPAEYSLG